MVYFQAYQPNAIQLNSFSGFHFFIHIWITEDNPNQYLRLDTDLVLCFLVLNFPIYRSNVLVISSKMFGGNSIEGHFVLFHYSRTTKYHTW